MDRYDEYKAMNGAGAGTGDRMNKLKAYMALYSSSGMGQGGVNTTDAGGNPTSYYNIGNGQRGRNAMEWATNQLNDESRQQQQNQPPPNFYGNPQGQQQPQFEQPQYVQPNYQPQENPFTNYLRKMMNPRDEFQRSNNSTVGVRG